MTGVGITPRPPSQRALHASQRALHVMALHSLPSQGRGSFWLLNCLLLLVGCGSQPPAPPIKPQANQPIVQSANALFEEVAGKAGVRFTHQTGASEHYYFIENTAAGCAFLDYDNDGFLDILLIQSGSSDDPKSKTQNPKSERPHCVLYHNNGNGTFTDVTAGSGLDTDLGYGQGVAIGDYDNDGYDDIFITAYGGNHLFHNEKGSGKFRETTKEMGLDKVHSTGYATSAAFGDYDNDGNLDLYICYYTSWTWEKDVTCKNREGQRDYCAPDLYDADTHRLFHNRYSDK